MWQLDMGLVTGCRGRLAYCPHCPHCSFVEGEKSKTELKCYADICPDISDFGVYLKDHIQQ
jgi:hypothetical protein